MLYFETAQLSADKAMKQAGITFDQINFFEYHDMFSIYAALQLEAIGFAIKGQGWKLAADKAIELKGKIPCATMGGLKARGLPGWRNRSVSSRRGGGPVARSGRSEPDRGRKIWIDPIPRRAGVHGHFSCF